jgi:hypothetical protein
MMDGQADLLEVVDVLAAASRLPGGLHRREEEGDKNADNGNHYQEFHQCEAETPHSGLLLVWLLKMSFLINQEVRIIAMAGDLSSVWPAGRDF